MQPSDKVSSRPRLYVPEHLLPAYIPTPAEVTVHAHEPVSLSLAVVQPTGGAEIDADDLAQLYPDAVNVDTPHYGYDVNGSVHFAGDEVYAGTLLREGGSISLGGGRGFRVLMTEPVQQGLVTSDTRVVVTNKPSDVSENFDDDRSVGSFAPTHRSLVEEFDADAFLASSLARSLASLTDDDPPAPTHDLDNSSSSSLTNSGSMTPRPGIALRSPSPVAAPDDVLQLESPVDEGMRFVLVSAPGRGPESEEDDNVCYAGVWALGRAGVFEGDWVCLRAVEDGGPGRTRMARVVAWERLDEESSDL